MHLQKLDTFEGAYHFKGFLDFSTAINFTIVSEGSFNRLYKPYFAVLSLLSVASEANPLIIFALTDM